MTADANELLESAARALSAGDTSGAFDHIQAMLSRCEVTIPQAVQAVELLRAMGQSEAAESVAAPVAQSIEQAQTAHGDQAEMQFDCGRMLLRLGRTTAGIAGLRAALLLDPTDPRPAYPLIGTLLDRDAPDELLGAVRPVLAAMARGEEADSLWQSLALGFAHFGHQSKAIALLEEAKAHWSGEPELLQALASRVGRDPAAPSSANEIAAEFDGFAENYDDTLAAIGNAGPQMVAQAVANLDLESAGALTVLDAGCGTGLSAGFLRPYARRLVGVDLSQAMLDRAATRGGYDELLRADIRDAGELPPGPFDLVIAADVMTYLGDLGPAFTALSARMAPGGWLIFTAEDGDAHGLDADWKGTGTGRVRHRSAYLSRALADAGFAPAAHEQRQILRREFGHPVHGICLAVRRRDAT